MRVAIKISYIGTNYCGWQTQENKYSIQEEIQKAIYELTKEKVKVYASGRTDSGVHAIGQIAHFNIDYNIKPEKISFALNQFLPADIRIVDSWLVSDDFNARFDVKKKVYGYKFYCSKIELPFDYLRAYQIPFLLDIEKMKECAKIFIGRFDFTSFCKVGKEEKDRVRIIYNCEIKEYENNHYEIEVCGSGFLHNMVRIISGTIIDVGLGKLEIENVKKLLISNSADRNKAGRTLPPYALYLKEVIY